jgi:anti-sigma B factor antagonist
VTVVTPAVAASGPGGAEPLVEPLRESCRMTPLRRPGDAGPVREDQSVQINSEGTDPVVVSVSGEIDLATSGQLETALAEALAVPGGTGLRLDCAGVDFIDSAGLRVLIAARGKADQDGRTFTLAVASDQVRRLVEIAGLSGVLGLSGPGPDAQPTAPVE